MASRHREKIQQQLHWRGFLRQNKELNKSGATGAMSELRSDMLVAIPASEEE
jgi:hypothetical protein